MHQHFLLFFLVFGTTSSSSDNSTCDSVEEDQEVVSHSSFWKGIDGVEFIRELGDETHDKFIGDNPKAFIMYYATWCTNSQDSRKEFGGAAKKLNEEISFGALDCEKAKKTCHSEEHRIKHYPVFILYDEGEEMEKYEKSRTTKAFVDYLKSH